MTNDRFHIDRVSAYSNTLPDDSGMPWHNPTSDPNRLNNALCLANNLHNPDLIASLTKNLGGLADAADDLERISRQPDVDAPTRVSMLYVARMLTDAGQVAR